MVPSRWVVAPWVSPCARPELTPVFVKTLPPHERSRTLRAQHLLDALAPRGLVRQVQVAVTPARSAEQVLGEKGVVPAARRDKRSLPLRVTDLAAERRVSSRLKQEVDDMRVAVPNSFCEGPDALSVRLVHDAFGV